jgi:hypothetical protein
MSVKLRLQRLEDSRKATADAVFSEITQSLIRQWIDDTAKSIHQGTFTPQFPEIDITGYSPQQLAVIASTKVWLEDQVISEQKRRSEHEQYKKPIA